VALFLEQVVKSSASVTGASHLGGSRGGHHWRRSMPIAGNCNPRAEEFAAVHLILHRYAGRNRLQALKPGGRFKVRALLATVQCGIALWAVSLKICRCGKHRRTVVATRRSDTLHQSRQARTGWILQCPRTLRRLGSIIPIWAARFAVRVLVPVLPVLAIFIQG
jgi:hypothetical protein